MQWTSQHNAYDDYGAGFDGSGGERNPWVRPILAVATATVTIAIAVWLWPSGDGSTSISAENELADAPSAEQVITDSTTPLVHPERPDQPQLRVWAADDDVDLSQLVVTTTESDTTTEAAEESEKAESTTTSEGTSSTAAAKADKAPVANKGPAARPKTTTTQKPTTTAAKQTETTQKQTTTTQKPPETTQKQTTTTEKQTTTTQKQETTTTANRGSEGGGSCFNKVYGTDFNDASALKDWFVYESGGNGGYGLRRRSAVKVQDGKLIITAENQNGTLVTGGLAHHLKQTYGKYRVRVRVDKDPGTATSAVVITWPESGNNNKHGENNIFETGWDKPNRWPFYSYIHEPWQDTSKPTQQKQFVHNADGTQWQIMTMEWTPNEIRVVREGSGDKNWEEHVLKENGSDVIPDVNHLLTIQLDGWKHKSPYDGKVNMEVDWVEVYDYTC